MTIASVTSGEVIDPAWGNSVADALNVGRYASVTRSSQTVSNNSNTSITSLTANYDPDGWAVSTGIEVPTTGVYLMSLQIDWSGGTMASNKRIITQIRAASITRVEDDRMTASSTPNVAISGTGYLTSGDVVSVLVYQNSGGSSDVTVNLSAYRLQ